MRRIVLRSGFVLVVALAAGWALADVLGARSAGAEETGRSLYQDTDIDALAPLIDSRFRTVDPEPVADDLMAPDGVLNRYDGSAWTTVERGLLSQEIRAWQQTPIYKRCRAAAKTMVRLRSETTGQYNETLPVPPSLRVDYVESVLGYLAYCFATGAGALKTATAPAVSDAMTNTVILYSRDFPVCGGYLLDGRLLTAKHCRVFSSSRELVNNTPVRAIEWKAGTSVRPVAGAGEAWSPQVRKLGADEANLASDSYADDLVVARVDGAQAADRHVFAPVRLTPGDPLIVITYNFLAKLLAREWPLLTAAEQQAIRQRIGRPIEMNDHPLSGANWYFRADAPLIDASPICFVQFVEQDFVFHACQSDEGASGSPVFAVQGDGSLRLAGVITGKAVTAKLILQRGASAGASQIEPEVHPNFSLHLIAALERIPVLP